MVREQIKDFASTKKLFRYVGCCSPTWCMRDQQVANDVGGWSSSGYKLVILDEADAMTNDAQAALRRGTLEPSPGQSSFELC